MWIVRVALDRPYTFIVLALLNLILRIVSGLQPTDSVIVDPSDSLVDGTPVRASSNSAGGSAR